MRTTGHYYHSLKEYERRVGMSASTSKTTRAFMLPEVSKECASSSGAISAMSLGLGTTFTKVN